VPVIVLNFNAPKEKSLQKSPRQNSDFFLLHTIGEISIFGAIFSRYFCGEILQ
jgi:hypothetical protein